MKLVLIAIATVLATTGSVSFGQGPAGTAPATKTPPPTGQPPAPPPPPANDTNNTTDTTDPTQCAVTSNGHAFVVSVSPRPQGRIIVDLNSASGRSVTVSFDGNVDSPLSREVELVGSEKWVVSASGERSAIPTQDGKGSVFLSYSATFAGCSDAKAKGTATLNSLVVAMDGTKWVATTPPQPVTITVTRTGQDLSATGATATGVAGLPSSNRGLDSAIPDALRETLSLLAEIAVDRAKAEGARLLKKRIKKYLCDDLSVGSVFGTTADGDQRLLPSTCGQLENLRISDLGGSATGFVDAIREDLVDVVVPAMLARFGAAPAIAKNAPVVMRFVSSSIRRGFSADEVRMALLSLLDDADIPTEVKASLKVALQCTKQDCSLADLKAMLIDLGAKKLGLDEETIAAVEAAWRCLDRGCSTAEVKAALTTLVAKAGSVTGVPASAVTLVEDCIATTPKQCTQQALATALEAIRSKLGVALAVDPFWSEAALRMIAILRPRADNDPKKLGAELVDLLVDVAKYKCAKDRKCEVVATSLRDVAVGLLEADYLRALGGVQATLVATNLGSRLKGKPLELVASVASYVSTYRDTKDQDAKVAHDLRKKALEGLIDAGTDRTNREGDVIVSLAASVGFTAGHSTLRTSITGVNDKQTVRDLRIPVGLTVQHIPANFAGLSLYATFAVADLAGFVSSPAVNENKDMNVDTKTRWSDFVLAEAQVGVRLFSARMPLVVGFDVYYKPRVTYEVSGSNETTAVVQVGAFAGFNIPFFDLN